MSIRTLGHLIIAVVVIGIAWYLIPKISISGFHVGFKQIPALDPNPSLFFELPDTYAVGDPVPVKVRNTGTTTYRYETRLSFNIHVYDSNNSQIVGNYTDVLIRTVGQNTDIRPGTTTSLGNFYPEQCTNTVPGFACPGTRPLGPGKYTLVGQFPKVPYEKDGDYTRIAKKITIVK